MNVAVVCVRVAMLENGIEHTAVLQQAKTWRASVSYDNHNGANLSVAHYRRGSQRRGEVYV